MRRQNERGGEGDREKAERQRAGGVDRERESEIETERAGRRGDRK